MVITLEMNKASIALLLLSGAFLYSSPTQSAQVASRLSLKLSTQIAQLKPVNPQPASTEIDESGFLPKISVLRGVAANNTLPLPSSSSNMARTDASKQQKTTSLVKAVHGGVQISLQENLNLMYSPSRLSRQVQNRESQGLYLVTDRGRLANWFLGIESSTYAASADVRRTSNNASFGVILSLD